MSLPDERRACANVQMLPGRHEVSHLVSLVSKNDTQTVVIECKLLTDSILAFSRAYRVKHEGQQ